jgi:hypothetical protein
MARCTNKDSGFPQFVAKMQCFEDTEHAGKHRYTMNAEEVDAWFGRYSEDYPKDCQNCFW